MLEDTGDLAKIHHRIKRNQQDDDATEMLNTWGFHTWLWLLGQKTHQTQEDKIEEAATP